MSAVNDTRDALIATLGVVCMLLAGCLAVVVLRPRPAPTPEPVSALQELRAERATVLRLTVTCAVGGCDPTTCELTTITCTLCGKDMGK